MDDDVCLECGAATSPLTATLELPSGAVDRRWRECDACGWESPYQDVLRRAASATDGGTPGLPGSGEAPRRASC